MDGQDGEALAEGRGVHRQRELPAVGRMQRLFAAAQQRGQEHRDLRQATALGQHNTETPQAERHHLRSAQMRQVG